jgi:hypothetical protein
MTVIAMAISRIEKRPAARVRPVANSVGRSQAGLVGLLAFLIKHVVKWIMGL